MAIVITRRHDSTVKIDRAASPSHEALYLIREDTLEFLDEFLARQAFEAGLTPIEDGKWLLTYTHERIGPSQIEVTCQYGHPTLEDLELSQEQSSNPFTVATFSSMGGTAHITQSLNTDAHPITEATAPDFAGAIGVTDSNIEGCDVPTPKLEFVLHGKKTLSIVTIEYLKFLSLSTGMANLYPWLTFGRRELVFLGFDSTLSSDGQMAIAYKFGASPSRTVSVTVDGETTEFFKHGWDYVWFRYKKKVDAAAKAMVHRPLAAYVEQVMYELDFTTLMVF